MLWLAVVGMGQPDMGYLEAEPRERRYVDMTSLEGAYLASLDWTWTSSGKKIEKLAFSDQALMLCVDCQGCGSEFYCYTWSGYCAFVCLSRDFFPFLPVPTSYPILSDKVWRRYISSLKIIC